MIMLVFLHFTCCSKILNMCYLYTHIYIYIYIYIYNSIVFYCTISIFCRACVHP